MLQSLRTHRRRLLDVEALEQAVVQAASGVATDVVLAVLEARSVLRRTRDLGDRTRGESNESERQTDDRETISRRERAFHVFLLTRHGWQSVLYLYLVCGDLQIDRTSPTPPL